MTSSSFHPFDRVVINLSSFGKLNLTQLTIDVKFLLPSMFIFHFYISILIEKDSFVIILTF